MFKIISLLILFSFSGSIMRASTEECRDASTSTALFNKELASSYDQRFASIAPVKDALYIIMNMIVGLHLPDEAKILCVGAGTGAEVISMAKQFPSYHFTIVEPAEAMLNICREKADEFGIASRCNFHNGYLDTLPKSDPFDAATSILVSQFLTDATERKRFFEGIAARLRSGGCLVSADLISKEETFKKLFDVWINGMMKYSILSTEEEITKYHQVFSKLSVLSPSEIENLMIKSGFEDTIWVYQALLIHGWYSRTK